MRTDLAEAIRKNERAFFGHGSSVKHAEKCLNADETVIYAVPCQRVKFPQAELKPDAYELDGKEQVIFFLTDKRMITYYRVLFTEKVEQFPISEMREFQIVRSKLASGSKVRIVTLTKILDLNILNRDAAEKLVEILSSIKSSNTSTIQSEKTIKHQVPIDKKECLRLIEDLSKMCDMGILTDKEFKTKKQELLNRL